MTIYGHGRLAPGSPRVSRWKLQWRQKGSDRQIAAKFTKSTCHIQLRPSSGRPAALMCSRPCGNIAMIQQHLSLLSVLMCIYQAHSRLVMHVCVCVCETVTECVVALGIVAETVHCLLSQVVS